jgi:predicted GNAT family acetyltransferase
MMEVYEPTNNTGLKRFEINEGNEIAFIEYNINADVISILHTDVPDIIGGKGIGSALVAYAFNYARKEKLGLKVYCSFAAIYAKKHPDWNDIIIPKK